MISYVLAAPLRYAQNCLIGGSPGPSERQALDPHPMHDHRQPASHGDSARILPRRQRPQRPIASANSNAASGSAGHWLPRRERPHHPIAASADSAAAICFTGSVFGGVRPKWAPTREDLAKRVGSSTAVRNASAVDRTHARHRHHNRRRDRPSPPPAPGREGRRDGELSPGEPRESGQRPV